MQKLFFTLMLISLMIVQACRNDSAIDPSQPTPEPQGERGVFIVSEGAFPNAGSVSFYNITKDSVYRSIVSSSAGWITPNDARVVGKKLYVVVNGTDRIYVRNADTFQAIDSIAMPTNSSPGFIWIVDSTKAYVANYNGTVSLLDLVQKTVVRTSAIVVNFPGGIVADVGKVYVSNYGLYPNLKNIVKVLDGNSLSVVDSIRVGHAAGSMVKGTARLYVVSTGSFPTRGKVYAINTLTDGIIDSVAIGTSPSDIAIVHQALYVLHDNRVMRLSASPLSVQDSGFISLSNGQYFYALHADEVRGDVYVSKIVSGGGTGDVEIYFSDGLLRRRLTNIGIFPGAFAFK